MLSPGFHVTSSFRYYPYAVGFQTVTSLTFFPKTHSQLLDLTPVLECLSYLRFTGTKPLSSPVSHISANVHSLAQLFKLEAWESSFTPLPHPPYLIHQNVSSTSERAQNNSLSISTATSPVKVIIILSFFLHPLFLFGPFWCFLSRGPKAVFANWSCHFRLITLHCT